KILDRMGYARNNKASTMLDFDNIGIISDSKGVIENMLRESWGAALPTPLAYRTPDEPIALSCG
ncbi:MAG: hypothetical protein IJV16_10130, partial [Lachnospiraceae bacterium]|nr:hypothetical protein [Lachnospiraceae bacterium]